MSDKEYKLLKGRTMKRLVVDDLVFYFDPKLSPHLREALIFLDETLGSGPVLKDSRTTTAGVIELKDGQRVFVKRENNKGWSFSAKYLFRRSRVFRAADAAVMLENLQIPTPKVVGVGSRRRLGILKSGYLITETLDNVLTSTMLCKKICADQKFMDKFVETVCHYMRLMHDSGIRHGDLKISNIYCMENDDDSWSFGLWDLDGTVRYPAALPHFLRVQELSRTISSLIKVMMENQIAAQHLDDIVALFLHYYNRESKNQIDAEQVSKAARRYLFRYNICG